MPRFGGTQATPELAFYLRLLRLPQSECVFRNHSSDQKSAATTVHRDRLCPAHTTARLATPRRRTRQPERPDAADPVTLALHEEADNALSHQAMPSCRSRELDTSPNCSQLVRVRAARDLRVGVHRVVDPPLC